MYLSVDDFLISSGLPTEPSEKTALGYYICPICNFVHETWSFALNCLYDHACELAQLQGGWYSVDEMGTLSDFQFPKHPKCQCDDSNPDQEPCWFCVYGDDRPKEVPWSDRGCYCALLTSSEICEYCLGGGADVPVHG